MTEIAKLTVGQKAKTAAISRKEIPPYGIREKNEMVEKIIAHIKSSRSSAICDKWQMEIETAYALQNYKKIESLFEESAKWVWEDPHSMPLIEFLLQLDVNSMLHYCKPEYLNKIEEPRRIAFAKILAEKGFRISYVIEHFAISDQQALVDIAILNAQHNPVDISFNIKKYGIEDQTVLVQLAKLATQHQDSSGVAISSNIKNFGIEDPAALIEIAKLSAIRNGADTSSWIAAYGITDPSARMQIAELAAPQQDFSHHIRNYGIADQASLIKLAKLAARGGDDSLPAFIAYYGIIEEATRIEIAKLAAQQNGRETSQWIKRFGIKNETALIEIAKLAAQQNGGATSANIEKYEIEDEKACCEIAKLALRQDIRGTCVHMHNYRLRDLTPFLDLLTYVAIREMENILKRHSGNYGIFHAGLREKYHIAVEGSPLYLPELLVKAEAQKDPSLKETLVQWVEIQQYRYALLVDAYVAREMERTRERAPERTHLLKQVEGKLALLTPMMSELFKIGSLRERSLIAEKVFALFWESEAWNLFSENVYRSSAKEIKPYALIPTALACLSTKSALVVGHFSRQVAEAPQLVDGHKMRQMALCLLQLADAQLSVQEKENMLLKQFVANDFAVQTLLQDLAAYARPTSAVETKLYSEKRAELVKQLFASTGRTLEDKVLKKLTDPSRPSLDKENILKNIFLKEKNIVKRVPLLTSFLSLKAGKEIAHSRSLSLTELQSARQKLILSIFNFQRDDFGTAEHFNKLWEENVERPLAQRYPDALFVYAGKIQTLDYALDYEKSGLQQKFNAFVRCLLEGKSKEKDALQALRQSTPHFSKIQQQLRTMPDGKEALELWEKTLKEWFNFPELQPLKAFLPASPVADKPTSEQFTELLINTWQRDQHVLGWEREFPIMRRLLVGRESPGALLKELSESKAERALDTDLQRLCLQLCQTQAWKEACELLASLQSAVQQLSVESATKWNQWLRDLEGFVKGMEAAQKKCLCSDWKIGMTRNPYDMLLLAWETDGCQSIDGDPRLNKCALAYMIDGKNSAVVIVDGQGALKARAVLRLLFDEENKIPVLFLERHYASLRHPDFAIALNAYAIEYAKQMGLPLVTKEACHKGMHYTGTIASLGSNAPSEYSDAGGGVTQGIFRISEPLIMWSKDLAAMQSAAVLEEVVRELFRDVQETTKKPGADEWIFEQAPYREVLKACQSTLKKLPKSHVLLAPFYAEISGEKPNIIAYMQTNLPEFFKEVRALLPTPEWVELFDLLIDFTARPKEVMEEVANVMRREIQYRHNRLNVVIADDYFAI